MKLHLDKNAFGVLIEQIHDKTGYRGGVIKDDFDTYFVDRAKAIMKVIESAMEKGNTR